MMIQSYLNVLPKLEGEAYDMVLAEIARLRQLQRSKLQA
jgi:hypothetical protein